jgi:putative hemolysin
MQMDGVLIFWAGTWSQYQKKGIRQQSGMSDMMIFPGLFRKKS